MHSRRYIRLVQRPCKCMYHYDGIGRRIKTDAGLERPCHAVRQTAIVDARIGRVKPEGGGALVTRRGEAMSSPGVAMMRSKVLWRLPHPRRNTMSSSCELNVARRLWGAIKSRKYAAAGRGIAPVVSMVGTPWSMRSSEHVVRPVTPAELDSLFDRGRADADAAIMRGDTSHWERGGRALATLLGKEEAGGRNDRTRKDGQRGRER